MSKSTEKTYNIGGRTYIQRPLVLGQWQQLTPLLRELSIPEGADVVGLVEILGERLPMCLAVVLTPEGESPQSKDLEAMARELHFAVDAETTLEVVDDFFTCNPVDSLLGKIEQTTGTVSATLAPIMATLLKTFASYFAAGISPAGPTSSGASPRPTSSPGSSTKRETSSSGRASSPSSVSKA